MSLVVTDAAPSELDSPSHAPQLYVEGKDAWLWATLPPTARKSPEAIVLPVLLKDSDGYELAKVRCVGGHHRAVALVAQHGAPPPPDILTEEVIVARALEEEVPQTRCFAVIDRDWMHREKDDYVRGLWERPFQQAQGLRLLYWTRHELESYFLDPALLCQSSFLRKGVTELTLWDCLLAQAKERVFLDAYNMTIQELRYELRVESPSIRSAAFNELGGLAVTRQRAMEKLKSLPWPDERARFARLLTDDALEGRLNAWLHLLTGEVNFAEGKHLEKDKGQWRERMAGKDLLCALLTSKFFKVSDGQRRQDVQGDRLVEAVLEDLAQQMAKGLQQTPPEFRHTPSEFRVLRAFFLAQRPPQP